MCGLTGWFDLSGRPVAPEILERMTATLVHRGPDSCGFFQEPGIGLGFRRLSIIDLATGDQPIASEDGNVVVVCDGEIYNYRELAAELAQRGHVFRTSSDVEVLVHLYEESGIHLLDRLNGQFAFALYDRRERRFFLARDRVGVNPLFWTVIDGLLIFGSEIKAILAHPAVPREVDLTGLDQILTFPGLVAPRTVFKGISALESGHFLRAGVSGVEDHEYWDLNYPRIGEQAARPERDCVEELRAALAKAVEYRLQADVPVGFYLSGGMDSSLIGALIGEISPGVSRHSFSIVFPDAKISEAHYQRLMARHLSQNAPFLPIYRAWKGEDWTPEPEDGLFASVLANRNPPFAVRGGIADILRDSDGAVYPVSSGEAIAADKELSRREGIDLEPAAAVALASLRQAVESGQVRRGELILLNLTGGGLDRIRRDFDCRALEPDLWIDESNLDAFEGVL